MGTAKRERQKANRQLRLEELAKQARRQKSKRTGLWIGGGVVAVVLIVLAINLLSSDSTSSTTATTVSASTSPDKPQVSLPAELPTDLVVTQLVAGSGPKAAAGDTVAVNYVGVLSADGTEFDNSYDRGSPISVTVGAGQVIQGWDQGLVGVQAGGRYQFDIPASLAYGDQGSGTIIKPGDAISFVIDVVSITPGTTATTTAGTTTPATSTPPTTA